MIEKNTYGDYPQIAETAWVHQSAVIIGKVTIGNNVLIGPGAVLRADEENSMITIENNCNVQDRVIIHALHNSAVHAEENCSLAHGCIVHGPCKTGKNCFIGFGSVVFKAELAEGVFIKHLSCVENVSIPAGKLIESKALVNNDDAVKQLGSTDKQLQEFAKKVVEVNIELAGKYNGL